MEFDLGLVTNQSDVLCQIIFVPLISFLPSPSSAPLTLPRSPSPSPPFLPFPPPPPRLGIMFESVFQRSSDVFFSFLMGNFALGVLVMLQWSWNRFAMVSKWFCNGQFMVLQWYLIDFAIVFSWFCN